jgi:hypothetical protein
MNHQAAATSVKQCYFSPKNASPQLQPRSDRKSHNPQLGLNFQVLGLGLAGNPNPWPSSKRTERAEGKDGEKVGSDGEGDVAPSSPGGPATFSDVGDDGDITVSFTCTSLLLPRIGMGLGRTGISTDPLWLCPTLERLPNSAGTGANSDTSGELEDSKIGLPYNSEDIDDHLCLFAWVCASFESEFKLSWLEFGLLPGKYVRSGIRMACSAWRSDAYRSPFFSTS